MSKVTSVEMPGATQIVLARSERLCLFVAWALTAVVSLVAIGVWGQSHRWQLSFDAYRLFPVLGLLAFSIMWAHYVATFIRQMMGIRPAVLSSYLKSTSLVVLALLFMHPGLLILQRFRDGYGLPPNSYESYVAPGLGWVVLLGSAAWLAFIAFEFRRFFSAYSWWKFVPIVVDIAMLAIVYHGLRIGDQLQMGWYRGLWVVYGLVLAGILGRRYYRRVRKYQLARS